MPIEKQYGLVFHGAYNLVGKADFKQIIEK